MRIKKSVLYDLIVAAYIISIFSLENYNYATIFTIIQITFIVSTAIVIIDRKKIVLNKYIYLQLILLIIALTIEIVSFQNSPGVSSELYTFFVNIVKISFLVQYFISIKNIEKVMFYLLLGGLVASFFVIQDYFSLEENLDDLKYASFYRIGAGVSGDNVNITAINLAISFSSAIYFLIRNKSKFLLASIYSISSVIILLSVVFTGSRKALIFCLIIFLIQFLYNGFKSTIVAVLAILITYIGLIEIKPLYYYIGHKFDFFGELNTVNLYARSDAIRQNLIEESIKIFNEYFMGVGFGGVANLIGVYSHNNFVEILVSLGIIGFLIYYFMYLYPLIMVIKIKIDPSISAFLISTIIALLIIEWSQVTYLYKVPMLVLALAASMVSINKTEVDVQNEKQLSKENY